MSGNSDSDTEKTPAYVSSKYALLITDLIMITRYSRYQFTPQLQSVCFVEW